MWGNSISTFSHTQVPLQWEIIFSNNFSHSPQQAMTRGEDSVKIKGYYLSLYKAVC